MPSRTVAAARCWPAPRGSGKTLLVNMLRGMLGEGFTPFVHLVFPQMATAELLAYLAGELDGSSVPSARPGVHESVLRIQHALADNTRPRPPCRPGDRRAQLLDNGQHAGIPAAADEFPAGQPAGR